MSFTQETQTSLHRAASQPVSPNPNPNPNPPF